MVAGHRPLVVKLLHGGISVDGVELLLAVDEEGDEASQADDGKPEEDAEDHDGDELSVDFREAVSLGVGLLLDHLVGVAAAKVKGDTIVLILGEVVVGTEDDVTEAAAVIVDGANGLALGSLGAGISNGVVLVVKDLDHGNEPLDPAGEILLAGIKPVIAVRGANGDSDEGGGAVKDGVGPGGLVRVALKVAGLLLEELFAAGGDGTAGLPVVAEDVVSGVVTGKTKGVMKKLNGERKERDRKKNIQFISLGPTARQVRVASTGVQLSLGGGGGKLAVVKAGGLIGHLRGRHRAGQDVAVVAEGLLIGELLHVLVGVAGGQGKVKDHAVVRILRVVKSRSPEDITESLRVIKNLGEGLANGPRPAGIRLGISIGVIDRVKVHQPFNSAGMIVLAGLEPSMAIRGADGDSSH